MAHNDLTNEFAKKPELLRQAVVEYETPLRLKPDYAEARQNLDCATSDAALLEDSSRASDAVARYDAAVRTRPDSAVAQADLARALSHIPGRCRMQ